MSKLSEAEEHTLRRLLQAVELFTAEDKDIPIQMVRVFLLSALNEGLGTVEMADKAGLPLSVASRHLIDLAELNRYREEGHQLVYQKINPMNRRERPVYLTPKGRGLVNRLHRIWGGRYVVTDRSGSAYFDGRTFDNYEEAVKAAKGIGETERPYGVWVCRADGNKAQNVEVYKPALSPEALAASDARNSALEHVVRVTVESWAEYAGQGRVMDPRKMAETLHVQFPGFTVEELEAGVRAATKAHEVGVTETVG